MVDNFQVFVFEFDPIDIWSEGGHNFGGHDPDWFQFATFSFFGRFVKVVDNIASFK